MYYLGVIFENAKRMFLWGWGVYTTYTVKLHLKANFSFFPPKKTPQIYQRGYRYINCH